MNLIAAWPGKWKAYWPGMRARINTSVEVLWVKRGKRGQPWRFLVAWPGARDRTCEVGDVEPQDEVAREELAARLAIKRLQLAAEDK